ncbi:MAG: hypothetical protein U0L08_04200 [Bacteroidales bacterium]|nr:hypothetical protein [Bacteroidales bacterium]
MKINQKQFTPDKVERLSNCEIFVFGSNMEGKHMGGAARVAYEMFGAEWGVGDGPTGRCYAIPTMHGGIEDIQPYAEKFIAYAKVHPMKRFLLTRVGCGIAGFKDSDMAQLFKDALDVPNITYPRQWLPYMCLDYTLGLKTPRSKKAAPLVISDTVLKRLCEQHLYEIGAGINKFLPSIKVRYVAEHKKFAYACFGDFFFFGDDFYVWEQDDKYLDDHNQYVVEEVFNDECEGRGYARRVIFAGVQTEFKDSNGERIYTGDVIKVEESQFRTEYMAVGALSSDDGLGSYCFILDNHSWRLADCNRQQYKMTRVGTVFYQLNPGDFIGVNQRTMNFNGWRDTEEDRLQKVLMAKFTPNYDQELWKYQGLEILGAEYDWR